MILQDILFRNVETCAVKIMYFKGERVTDFVGERLCLIEKDATLSSLTYFNSFSIGKWKKYTILDNLKLRVVLDGTFSINVRHVRRMKNTLKDVMVATKSVKTDGCEEVFVDIPVDNDVGIYYFTITSLDEEPGKFYGGSYETEVNEEELPEVKIAIDICTFRREEYIAHNMDMLNRYIIKNPECDMYGKLEVFISDNNKSLFLTHLHNFNH